MSRGALAGLLAAALAAGGCERSSLILSLGLDAEDKAAQAWLGYYPTAFVPVGACPSESAFEAQRVAPAGLEEAVEKLEERFAVELPPGIAQKLTGLEPPKPSAAAREAMAAEAAILEAQRELEIAGTAVDLGLSPAEVQRTLTKSRKAIADANALIVPPQRPYLVRGVTFDPGRAPEITVCYGDVEVSDALMGSTVPKMYRQPMVVWVTTPVRRGRVTASVTQ